MAKIELVTAWDHPDELPYHLEQTDGDEVRKKVKNLLNGWEQLKQVYTDRYMRHMYPNSQATMPQG